MIKFFQHLRVRSRLNLELVIVASLRCPVMTKAQAQHNSLNHNELNCSEVIKEQNRFIVGFQRVEPSQNLVKELKEVLPGKRSVLYAEARICTTPKLLS